MELPKVYEPVESLDELQDRLNMFLAQYNDMVRGHGMDLVFFQDAVEHLIKVLRNNYPYLILQHHQLILLDIEDSSTSWR